MAWQELQCVVNVQLQPSAERKLNAVYLNTLIMRLLQNQLVKFCPFEANG